MFPEIYWWHHYDIPMAPVRAGDLVVDVGANHGFAAAYFARAGADVLAFEPSPSVFTLLGENIAANGLQSRVQLVCAAITDREGEAELCETTAMGGGMSSLGSRFMSSRNVAISRRTRARTRSLRNVLAECAGPDSRRVRLLKLDCEGSELDMLKTLGPRERAALDSIALECHPGAYELSELFTLLAGWPEFQISKAAGSELPNLVLHLVQKQAVGETLTKMGAG